MYRYRGAPTDPLVVWNDLGVAGETRWFGWNEAILCLPHRLAEIAPSKALDYLRLFNAQAELRLLTQGGKPTLLLLTEEIQPPSDTWEQCGVYDSEAQQHILLGDPPKSARGETTQLVDVAYPITFDYGVPLAPSRERLRKVVAHTRYYYDTERRLRYIRYATISSEEFKP
ncbi:MAG: hypothetical protein ACUVV1_09525 [Fimbriimonadales bacterium]